MADQPLLDHIPAILRAAHSEAVGLARRCSCDREGRFRPKSWLGLGYDCFTPTGAMAAWWPLRSTTSSPSRAPTRLLKRLQLPRKPGSAERFGMLAGPVETVCAPANEMHTCAEFRICAPLRVDTCFSAGAVLGAVSCADAGPLADAGDFHASAPSGSRRIAFSAVLVRPSAAALARRASGV